MSLTTSAASLGPETLAMLGQPVELGQIGRELKKLWESTGGTQTRASLVNFAVYGTSPSMIEDNTELISKFTREHSCRAILIAHDRQAPETRVRAWINAHCHLPRAGAKHVCCEQITFLIEGGSDQLLTNILFANLDSDLPLYLWWQGDLSATLDPQLLTWVDRLIFDSRDWSSCKGQFTLLQRAITGNGARLILCDLNWTRTLHLRQALAQLFDHPENLAQLPKLQRLKITHAPGCQTTALLFAAWISAQLRWTVKSRTGSNIVFISPEGREITGLLEEAPGAPVSRCQLSNGAVSVVVQRDPGSAFHRGEVHLRDGTTYSHLFPAGSDEIGCLLDEELTLGGRHRVYLKALEAAQPLL